MFGVAPSNFAQQKDQARPCWRPTGSCGGNQKGGQPCLLEGPPRRNAAPPKPSAGVQQPGSARMKLEKPPVHHRPVRK
jgi:hypothetical protein